MDSRTLADGVQRALAGELAEAGRAEEVASAIVSAALYEGDGSRQLLSLDSTDKLVQFDILKAVFAAAGVLGALIPTAGVAVMGELAAGPMGIASILAAIGALGALRGLTQPLPKTCALVVRCLLVSKTMAYDNLKAKFCTAFGATKELAEVEFNRALERLEQIGSIKCREDNVRLVERVVVRR